MLKFELMNKLLLFLITCIVFPFVANAQTTDSAMLRKIVNETLQNSGAYEHLRYITKEIGHRLSGSSGAAKAVEATTRMLKEAGADTVYWQPCYVPQWVRGSKESGEVVSNGVKRKLKLLALGNSVGSGAKGVAAEVITVKSLDEVRMLGGKVKGKIVFYNVKMDPTNIRTFRSYGQSGAARRDGPSLAAKYGAIGVMVRSLASNADDHPHTGTTQYNDSFPKIPAVAISTNDADWIAAESKKGRITGSFITHSQMLEDVLSYNVIGELRGSKTPNRYITVGGHLDSWDVGEGAHDDGAGCVQSIEVLRSFKANNIRPNNTIRAVMFMNEENGLRGGKTYLDSAIAKKETHLFAIESDAGGFTPRGIGISTNDSAVIKRFFSWQPLFKEYLADNFDLAGGGADISPLRSINTITGSLSVDSQRYFDIHHAETDVFENVSKRELDLGAGVMAAFLFLVDKYGLK